MFEKNNKIYLLFILLFSNITYSKKIILTGGAGFIGSHVAEFLLTRGDEVIIIDNLNDSCPINIKERNLEIVKESDHQNKLSIYIADICNQEKMHEIFSLHKPDVLCHLAARAGVRTSIENPTEYMRSNIIGSTVLFDMCVQHHVPHVVFASSSSVYGERTDGPFSEIDRVEKQSSPYGMTKRAGELLAQVYNHLYGISFNCLRFFTVYGPRGRIDMAAYIFMNKIARGETITVLGDGSAIRDFTYIDDIVQGVVAAIDRPMGYEIFNLGRGEPVVLKDFITTIEKTVGKKAVIEHKKMIAGDVSLTSADISKAQRLLGYEPKVSVKDGLKALWKEYKRKSIIKKPLKILFIIEKFPWHTKAIMMNQIISLLDRGHDVHVYTYHGISKDEVDKEVLEYKLYDRIHYNMFPSPQEIETFDIIVCQYGDLGKEFIKLKHVIPNKAKFFTFFRGGDITTDRHMEYGQYDELISQSDLLFPICHYFKYKLCLLGANPKKIKVVYSPINCDRFNNEILLNRKNEKKKDNIIRILSVNRLEEEKAVDDAINGVALAIEQYPNIEYIIVGDGKKRSYLERLISHKKLEEKVKLVGWKKQEEIKELLSTSDIFILASVTPERGNQEAIPNVLKEAMLMGVPVITTYHGAITELVIDEITGFLVPERCSGAIAKKIKFIIENSNCVRSIIRRAARKTKKMFDMNIVNKRLIDIFEQSV